MRIAIDIDSTLHHYWDVLSDAARRRFGIELPYEEQFDWGITRLKPKQLEVCIAETHSPAVILKGRPYPGAVETVQRWHEQGHFIHITTHRESDCHEATAAWLNQIGLPFDELYCSFDKVARCTEIDIDVLIDDSPTNIERAIEAGIVVATLRHPWNTDVCDVEDVVAAEDWPELERELAPVLDGARRG
ncbi:MAG: hypothetical protein JWP17_417 [Solirubrobacterales bacterium]|jgi:uncharacterized HAD superfamily protein|nr:hypothetical protein [Solirubrobacterales bacterium]